MYVPGPARYSSVCAKRCPGVTTAVATTLPPSADIPFEGGAHRDMQGGEGEGGGATSLARESQPLPVSRGSETTERLGDEAVPNGEMASRPA